MPKIDPPGWLRQAPRLILGGICLLLLAMLAATWLEPPPKPAPLEARESIIEGDAQPDDSSWQIPARQPMPLESYSEIIKRPVFMPTRRPWTPPPQKKPPPTPPPLTPPPTWEEKVLFKLSGIVITPETKVALLENNRDQLVYRVAEGQEVLGWMLTEIQPRSVALQRDSLTQTVELEVATGSRLPAKGGNPRQDALPPLDDGFPDYPPGEDHTSSGDPM